MTIFRWPLRRRARATVAPQGDDVAEAATPGPGPTPGPAQAQSHPSPELDAGFANAFRTRSDDRSATSILGPWGGLASTAQFAVAASDLPSTFATQRWVDAPPVAATMIDDPQAFVAALPSLASYANPSATASDDGSVFAASLPVAASTTTFRDTAPRRVPVRRRGDASAEPLRVTTPPAGSRPPVRIARRVEAPSQQVSPPVDIADVAPAPLGASAEIRLPEPSTSHQAPNDTPAEPTDAATLPLVPPAATQDAGTASAPLRTGPQEAEPVSISPVPPAELELVDAPSAPVRQPAAEPGLPLASARRVGTDVSPTATIATTGDRRPMFAARKVETDAGATPTPARPEALVESTGVQAAETPGLLRASDSAAARESPAEPIAQPLDDGPGQDTRASLPPEMPVARLAVGDPEADEPIRERPADTAVSRSASGTASATPGSSQGVQPRRFAVGEPVETGPGAPPFVSRAASPRPEAEIDRVTEAIRAAEALPGTGTGAVSRVTRNEPELAPGEATSDNPAFPLARQIESNAGLAVERAPVIHDESGASRPSESRATESFALVRREPPSVRSSTELPFAAATTGFGQPAEPSVGAERVTLPLFAEGSAAPIAQEPLRIDSANIQPRVRVSTSTPERLPTILAPGTANAPGSGVVSRLADSGTSAALPLAPQMLAGGGPAGAEWESGVEGGFRNAGASVPRLPAVPAGQAFGVASFGSGSPVTRRAFEGGTETEGDDMGGAMDAASMVAPGDPPKESDIESLTDKVWQRVRAKLLQERERRRGLP